MLLMLVCMGTWAYSGIKLTFNRVDAGSGTATNAVSDVTVNVTDTYGNALPGITATLESTSITELKTGSAAALGRTTNSVLAPNAGYANEQNSTIEYVFCVTGLDTEFAYNKVALDVYALTGGGEQQNPNDTQREWTFGISTGETAGGVASFISQSGNEICADGTSLSDGLYHKNWEMTAGSEKAATATLYIKVVLTRTASLGCYAGLAGVTLSGGRKWESRNGWTPASGGYGAYQWYGVKTPGNATNTFSFNAIQLMQRTGGDNNDNYLAIARVSATSTLSADHVVAISNDHHAATSNEALVTYNFSENVNLLGGTVYYFVFLSSNTPTDGAYTVSKSRLSLNHTDYGAYPYGNSAGNVGANHWLYYKVLTDLSSTTGFCTGDDLGGTMESGNWKNLWTSSTSPSFTITSSANNINNSSSKTSGGLDIRSGSAQSATYTIKAPTGYLITGYKLFGKALASNQTVTPAEGGSAVVFTTVGNSLRVTGLKKTSTSFVLTGANDGLYLHAMEVNLSPCSSITSLPTDNDKVYVITNARGTWNFANDATAMTAVAAGNTDLNNVQQHVALIYNDENYYLYSVNAGKYLTASNTLTVVPSENEQIAIEATGNATYPWFFKFKNVSGKNFNVDGNQNVFINTWGTIDGGNSNAILPVGSYDLTQAVKNLTKGKYVTYKVYYNDTEVLSEDNVLVYIDDAPDLPTSMQRDYCTYTYYSDEERTEELDAVTSSSNTIYVNATWDGPFNISSDFANAEWYLLRMKGATLNMKYQDGSSAYPLEAIASYNIDEEDYYAWAFTGNPYDGFEILNRQAGSTKKLYQGATVNNGDYPTMSADNESSWLVTRYSDTEFSVNPSGYAKYWNAWNGGATVQYWQDGITDPGSRLSVLPEGSIDFTSMVESYIVPYILNASDKYFAISSTDAATLVADYADGGSKTSWNKSEYQSFKSALDAAMKLPTTGYYRIKSNDANVYLNAVNGSQLTYNGSGTEPSSIVYMTGSGNTFKLKMQGKNVVPQSNGDPVVLNNSEYTLTLSSPVVNGAIVPGRVNIGTDATATNYLVRGTSPNVNSLNPTSNVAAAQWIIEDATSATVSLTAIGDNTYATTYLPFDATVNGNDVTANAVVVADVHVGYVVPTALEYNKIPAGTPVILRGANTSATSATLTINTGDAFSALSGTSALEGVYVNTPFALEDGSTTDYFLGMLDGALGFYHSAIETPASSGNYTLSANRAYLPASVVAAAGARGFSIMWNDDEVTGIRTIDGQKSVKNGAFYDLSGRRVENPQHGMYIVNGRVVVIK